jgi:hypothetical protein
VKSQLSSTLTYVFLIHFIIAGLFGLGLLLFPAQLGSLYGMETPDLYPWRMLGAAMLGIAATSWFGYKADTWESVRIVLVLEVVWPILACLVILYENLIVGVTAFNWINFAIMAIFAALFTWFYFRK